MPLFFRGLEFCLDMASGLIWRTCVRTARLERLFIREPSRSNGRDINARAYTVYRLTVEEFAWDP